MLKFHFRNVSILNTLGKVIFPNCPIWLVSESSINELCSEQLSLASSLSGPLISASSWMKTFLGRFGTGWESSDELEMTLRFLLTGRSIKTLKITTLNTHTVIRIYQCFLRIKEIVNLLFFNNLQPTQSVFSRQFNTFFVEGSIRPWSYVRWPSC